MVVWFGLVCVCESLGCVCVAFGLFWSWWVLLVVALSGSSCGSGEAPFSLFHCCCFCSPSLPHALLSPVRPFYGTFLPQVRTSMHSKTPCFRDVSHQAMILIPFRTSLRSSSREDPRYPLLTFFFFFFCSLSLPLSPFSSTMCVVCEGVCVRLIERESV